MNMKVKSPQFANMQKSLLAERSAPEIVQRSAELLCCIKYLMLLRVETRKCGEQVYMTVLPLLEPANDVVHHSMSIDSETLETLGGASARVVISLPVRWIRVRAQPMDTLKNQESGVRAPNVGVIGGIPSLLTPYEANSCTMLPEGRTPRSLYCEKSIRRLTRVRLWFC
ncbi:hypothetical protein P153DRAFT_27123 [Dothidotthia symphoricarpi CBS 119687]|uniref:Uncharacterized protein n=1 Tax=Dothidotthia symphoricarpi CBS 119687 TaxID=1392245 RepID=A0A6A6ACJ2_9PLEO|nr:uncharacterized protein P153DRAFT_27123 [Dothidotthia symphoricarpi CBS 119687]KAF2128845.1 hypothetical protein P153DRAFT_27123 [Dothidotthia symphoricarpi CBS 119687]